MKDCPLCAHSCGLATSSNWSTGLDRYGRLTAKDYPTQNPDHSLSYQVSRWARQSQHLSAYCFQVSLTPRPFCPMSVLQFSSVAQSCLTLCNPTNSSTPGLPVHHHLPEFTQTDIH